jgi:hypothetical protein
MLEPVKYVMLRDMAKPRPIPFKQPTDPFELAKLVGDIATGQAQEQPGHSNQPTTDELRRVMSALGKIGGRKGGKARAKSLSKQRRKEIAIRAAVARWKGKKKLD